MMYCSVYSIVYTCITRTSLANNVQTQTPSKGDKWFVLLTMILWEYELITRCDSFLNYNFRETKRYKLLINKKYLNVNYPWLDPWKRCYALIQFISPTKKVKDRKLLKNSLCNATKKKTPERYESRTFENITRFMLFLSPSIFDTCIMCIN